MTGRKVTSLVLGVLFGIGLLVLAYIYLVAGIALGLNGFALADLYIILCYLLFPLAIVAIVGASVIFASPLASKIMLSIPLVAFILEIILLIVGGLFSGSLLITSVIFLILGLTSTILAYCVKKQKRIEINQPELN